MTHGPTNPQILTKAGWRRESTKTISGCVVYVYWRSPDADEILPQKDAIKKARKALGLWSRKDRIDIFTYIQARIRYVNSCWLWGNDDKKYGKLRYQGKEYLLHRLVWILRKGPIPDGLGALHTCDTPACINPEHLFLGTQVDNMKDRDAKGRVAHGEKHCRARLSDQDIVDIRWLRAMGANKKDIQAEYKIGQPYLSRLLLQQRR